MLGTIECGDADRILFQVLNAAIEHGLHGVREKPAQPLGVQKAGARQNTLELCANRLRVLTAISGSLL
jgi:hypothetical protein